jgi:hypothetical protein
MGPGPSEIAGKSVALRTPVAEHPRARQVAERGAVGKTGR